MKLVIELDGKHEVRYEKAVGGIPATLHIEPQFLTPDGTVDLSLVRSETRSGKPLFAGRLQVSPVTGKPKITEIKTENVVPRCDLDESKDEGSGDQIPPASMLYPSNKTE